ncbi:MAG: helix-turn-helix transcriptional regulator [Pseudomonadota bacterium]
MSPHLSDLLTHLLSPGPRLSALAVILAFRRFTTGLGLEFCNYGVFEIHGGKPLAGGFTDTNMPDPWIEEYLSDELYGADYTLRQSTLLTPEQPFLAFEFGEWTVPRLSERDAISRPVLLGAADAGLRDALALIGRSPVAPGDERERFFGFAFGGDPGSAGKAAECSHELMIGAFAAMNALEPHHAALAEACTTPLTVRERDVLALHARGMRRDRIAHRLGITLPTVDLHTANLRRKLKAQTIAEAVAKGYRFGLL